MITLRHHKDSTTDICENALGKAELSNYRDIWQITQEYLKYYT